MELLKLLNDLYGQSCIDAADKEKRSKFLDQLQTLESNELTDEELSGGSLGGNQDYGDISVSYTHLTLPTILLV